MALSSAFFDDNSTSVVDDLQCSLDAVIDMRFAPDEVISDWLYNLVDRYMILVGFTLLFILGAIGNCAFLLVVALVEEMKTHTNFYLANLAIADLLFLVSQIYDVFITYLISPTVKSLAYHTHAGCALMFTTLFAGHFASVAFMVLLALERYLAICKPLKQRMVVAKGRTVKLVIGAWMFGLIYAVAFVAPHFFVLHKSCIFWPDDELYETLPSVTTSCVPLHWVYKAFPYIVQSFPYTAALIVCSYLYARIIMELSTRTKALPCENVGDTRAKQVRNQVARLLIVNAAVFFACHFPHFLLRFNDALVILSQGKIGWNLSRSVWYILHWFNRTLGTANSVVNPVIYSATNSRYRNAFWTVFKCTWKRADKVPSISEAFTRTNGQEKPDKQ